MPVPPLHYVLKTRLEPPYPEGMQLALFGLGCLWGAERKFQGNDVGTQYRSAIFTHGSEQAVAAARSREAYGRALAEARHGAITTEVREAPEYYFAEDYHQQYLAKTRGATAAWAGPA